MASGCSPPFVAEVKKGGAIYPCPRILNDIALNKFSIGTLPELTATKATTKHITKKLSTHTVNTAHTSH
jgi:hypothetical protein